MRTEGPWNLNDVQYWSNKDQWAVPPKGSLYQGGYYIADITYADGRKFGIILSPKSGGEQTSLQWKTGNTNTANTTNTNDGFANSEAMMVAGSSAHPAANFCRSLSIGGYTDWYLPARQELTTIWNNRTIIPNGEEMVNDFYWTSTQSAASFAWAIRFSSTFDDLQSNKNLNRYVRAIRRFSLE